MFNQEELAILARQLSALDASFSLLPDYEESEALAPMESVLSELSSRMADNYPYFHPFYLGQMLKPPHPMARLAYSLCLYINPNNHALDGGRATSAMEKEAVAEIANMFGWREHLGHLTGGGTFANLEALWIAKMLRPGTSVAASELAHYTHERISRVLDMEFEKIPCDASGRMDVLELETRLQRGNIGTVVVTLGTTAAGTLDPLDAILALKRKYRFRVHVDAAYGGYFTLCEGLSAASRGALEAMAQADSIVVDPHKHGMQPYGCGCVLFNDPGVGIHYKHDSPYTYFQFGRAAFRGDQSGMLPGRRIGRRALGHSKAAAFSGGRGVCRCASMFQGCRHVTVPVVRGRGRLRDGYGACAGYCSVVGARRHCPGQFSLITKGV